MISLEEFRQSSNFGLLTALLNDQSFSEAGKFIITVLEEEHDKVESDLVNFLCLTFAVCMAELTLQLTNELHANSLRMQKVVQQTPELTEFIKTGLANYMKVREDDKAN